MVETLLPPLTETEAGEVRLNVAHPITRDLLLAEFNRRTDRGEHPEKQSTWHLRLAEGVELSFWQNMGAWRNHRGEIIPCDFGRFQIDIHSPDDAPASLHETRFVIESRLESGTAGDQVNRSVLANDHGPIPDKVALTNELFCYLAERFGFRLTEPD